MSFLKIRDLTYTYPGGIRALDGFGLEAGRGEFIAVIGPNAAGKSTLALLLKGLLKAEKGSVRIEGSERPQEGTDPRVGILFANPENQIITSIVEEDVAFGLEVSGHSSEEIADRVRDVLDRLGIHHLEGRMPHLLSGGEQQMVALAGVLVQEPDILVLDEPTTFLDPDGKAAVLTALQDQARRGKVVILITHNMSEAGMADRIVMLQDGCLVFDGKPMELFLRADISEAPAPVPPFLYRLMLSLKRSGVRISGPLTVREVASALNALIGEGKKPIYNPVSSVTGKGDSIPAIGFEGICFRYGLPSEGGKDLLSHLDLAVPEGCIAMICGSNGSGKSTLLQMTNGLIEPDEGRVVYKGRPLSLLRREKGLIHRRIALLFQNPEKQLFSETVFEDIAFGPRNLSLQAAEVKRRVSEAASWVGIDERLFKRPVYSLSGGQMRRVAVAGVLAMDPDVLVLDEPTDSLDPEGVSEFYDRARKYSREKGTTILMAAHSVPEEIRYIDYFGHLEGGTIRSCGSPETILVGQKRTVPARYLPDHLLLQEMLSDAGAVAGPMELDPFSLEKKLMKMIKERQTTNV